MPTEFQKSVWAEIDKIPFGKTKSYKEIAEAIGKPKAQEQLPMLVEKIQPQS